MIMRYLLALVCMSMLMAACGSSHDGALLWNFEIKKTHKQWAAVDLQRLYLCADDVYCLEIETGRLLWERETFGAHSSAPVLAEGRLFFQCGGLYALDAKTGRVLWEFWTKKWATIAPAADARRVYAPVGGRLHCLDAVSGKRLWSIKTGLLEKTPVLIGGRLFFAKGAKIVCLDPLSGQVLWRYEVGSDPVQLAPGGAYLLSAGSAGRVRAHRVDTGQVQWIFDLPLPFSDVSVLPSGQLLINADALYCLNQESGVPLWTVKQGRGFKFGPSILGNHVFLRPFYLKEFFRVSSHDGTLLSRFPRPGGGLLLRDANGESFFSGVQSREISCLSVQAL